MDRRAFLRASALLPVAAPLTGCAADELLGTRNAVTVAMTWSGAERAAFQAVLAATAADRDYAVDLVPRADEIGGALRAKGIPRPDIVMLPETGQLREDEITSELEQLNWLWDQGKYPSQDKWRRILSPDDDGERIYGVPFKLSHKSAVWYRKDLVPRDEDELDNLTWDAWIDLLDELTRTLPEGVAPLALGGADGWVLTDFFENVLLAHDRTLYATMTTPSMRDWSADGMHQALVQLGDIWGRPGMLAGGRGRALASQFPDAVRDVFQHRDAAMVVSAEFAEFVIRQIPGLDLEDDVGVFQFPRLTMQPAPLIVGSDVIVVTKPASNNALDLARRLAGAEAPLPWISDTGGFIAANPGTDDVLAAAARRERGKPPYLQHEVGYSPALRKLKKQLDTADFSFELSDQLGSMGGNEALRRVLTDFLKATTSGVPSSAAAETAQRELERLEERQARR